MDDKQLDIFDNGEEETMLLPEVAKALNVTGKTIRKYVDKLFPGKMINGIATFLNETEVTAIKLELEKNHHLNRSVELPKTELEENLIIQQAQNLLFSRIDKLQKQLAEAQPKIEFHDKVGDSKGSYSVGQTAKLFETGRNRFFDWLRYEKIFFNREPYQKYIDRGYFTVKTDSVNQHVQKQAFVTPKGLQWLEKRFSKHSE